MNWKKGLGVGLIFIGFFLCLTARVLTGAVVGFSFENYLGLLGVLVLVGGILLILTTKTLEERATISPDEFIRRVNKTEGDKNKIVLVLDSSAILQYDKDELRKILSSYENVIIPDSVIKEIHNSDLRKVILQYRKSPKGYEKYEKIAEKYLERTTKPQLSKTLLPYLKGEKSLDDLKSGTERMRLKEKMEKVRRIMERRGVNYHVAEIAPGYTVGEIRRYLEEECNVSEADIDIVATIIALAKEKKHAIVGEKDIDIREAIEMIKEGNRERGRLKHPKLGGNLDYVEVYKKEYVHAA